MRDKTIEIKFWYIVVFIFTLFSIYVFSTGWECGFQGNCLGSNDIWQGFARHVLSILLFILFIIVTVMGFVEEWYIEIRNPFYNEADQEAWEEYQRWLKERK